jgi:hypothetical protein
MPWASVSVSYADYFRSYKALIRHHNHALQGDLITRAKAHALIQINMGPPPRFPPVTLNQLRESRLRVNLSNDPGEAYTEI